MEVSDSETVSTRQEQIAVLTKQLRGKALTSLNQYLDLPLLRTAYAQLRKNRAVGVDGVTAQEYEEKFEENLAALLERAKSGRYRAPPVRRAYIPKADGQRRPLGIPTLEDKLLQRAVKMLLEPIYETVFLPCSYGFRPGRSAHQAIEAVRAALTKYGGGTVLEVDIRRFFDELDLQHLRTFLRQRVQDGVLLRLIGKWLKAGVLEEGVLSYPTTGTPQGGVISPLLANIYLHYVLDGWFTLIAPRCLQGPATLVRYADDFVLVFARADDAHRMQTVLPQRFARYGLRLHPTKTRLLDFQRPSRKPPEDGPKQPPGCNSFDFLGFTFHWGRSRRGNWVVRQKTAKDRLARSARRIWEWCRAHRHAPLRQQHAHLTVGLRGHYRYFGVTGNYRALEQLKVLATRAWFTWLRRRAQRRTLVWERFNLMLKYYPLPRPRIYHSVFRPGANP